MYSCTRFSSRAYRYTNGSNHLGQLAEQRVNGMALAYMHRLVAHDLLHLGVREAFGADDDMLAEREGRSVVVEQGEADAVLFAAG